MEARQINSNQLRQHWREILDFVQHHGEHITVLRYSKPGAVIVPAEWYEQARQALDRKQERA